MSCLVARIDWGGPGDRTADIEKMLQAAVHRCPDGTRLASLGEGTLALGLRSSTVRQRDCAEPIYVNAPEGLAVVCDARFDNVDELHRRLGLPSGTQSDAQLVAQAYCRWDSHTAEHLDGDFAFVVWDSKRKRVYAARDCLGVRSLHYRMGGGALLVATEPAQLLADAGTSRDLNARMVLDHLTWQYAHHRLTFFESIQRIEPGHALLATAEHQRQVRYWHPPLEVSGPAPLTDYADEFATIFRKAVAERLASPTPVGMHLSGGLDSTSIVCVASEEQRRNPIVAPSVFALAAKFPGLDCDESGYIKAVEAETRVQVFTWNGAPDEPSPNEFEVSDPATPYGRLFGIGNGPPSDFELARNLNARVLLSGQGGNQVTTEPLLLETLLRERRWSAVRDRLALAGFDDEGRFRWRRAIRILRQGKYALLPMRWSALMEAQRARLNWRNRSMPRWLGSKLRQVWPDAPPDVPATDYAWSNPRQRRLWAQVTNPRQEWVADYLDLSASRYGIEVRLPFRDTSLVRFMMALPTSLVAEFQGPRHLHERALAPLLPKAVRDRGPPAVFNAAQLRNAIRVFSEIQGLVRGRVWACGDYVDQREAIALLDRLDPKFAPPETWADWIAIREIAALEYWMRAM